MTFRSEPPPINSTAITMLKSIKLKDVQGLSGTFEFLTPMTIITGKNREGKSGLLNSIVLDIVGFSPNPKIGKMPGRIKLMASGRKMKISSVHDRYSLSQTWGEKYECTPADHQFSSVELVSLNDFFQMTQKEQSRFLIRRSGHVESPLDVWTKILLGMNDRKWKTQQVVELKDLAPAADSEFRVWIESLVDNGQERLKLAKAKVKGAEQVVKSATTQGSQASVAETPVSVQTEIDQLTTEMEDVNRHLQTVAAAAATTANNLRNCLTNGKRVKGEVERLEAQQVARPKCSRCGNDVGCAHCENAAATESKELTAKKAEKTKLGDEWRALEAQNKASTINLEEERKKLLPLTEKLDGLQTRQAAYQASLGRRQVVQSAETDLEALREKSALLKDFVDVAVEVIREVLEGGMGKTLEVCNKLVNPVLGVDVQYKDGGFGYVRAGEQWVPLETFSGIENLVFNLGMAMALASDTDEKILIVDEFGIMLPEPKQATLRTIAGLIKAGVIEQFIAVDPTWALWKFPPSKQLTVITVGEAQPTTA